MGFVRALEHLVHHVITQSQGRGKVLNNDTLMLPAQALTTLSIGPVAPFGQFFTTGWDGHALLVRPQESLPGIQKLFLFWVSMNL